MKKILIAISILAVITINAIAGPTFEAVYNSTTSPTMEYWYQAGNYHVGPTTYTWYVKISSAGKVIINNSGGGIEFYDDTLMTSTDMFISSTTGALLASTQTWTGSNTFENLTTISSITITNDGSGSSIDADLLDGNHETYFMSRSTAALTTTGATSGAERIGMPIIAGAKNSTLGDFIKLFGSPGVSEGGTITDSGGGYVSISSGTGFIKATDDDTAELMACNWSALSNVQVPTDTIKYIGVEYNGGSPVISTSTTETWDLDTSFALGSIINQAGDLYILNNPWLVTDGITNIVERFQADGYCVKDLSVGGLTIGVQATRYVTLTTGKIWSRFNEFDITAKDTSGSDRFYAFYRDGGTGWTRSAASQQYSNLYYDDNSGTLALISNNKYASFWVFVEIDTDNSGQLMLIYPQNSYNTAAEAEAGPIPAFPSTWYKHGYLAGQIIFQQGQDAVVEVLTFDDKTIKTAALAADHPNLSNLAWTSSGHTGTASTLAGFDGAGAATAYTESDYAKLASTQTFTGINTFDDDLTMNGSSITYCAEVYNDDDLHIHSDGDIRFVADDTFGNIYASYAGTFYMSHTLQVGDALNATAGINITHSALDMGGENINDIGSLDSDAAYLTIATNTYIAGYSSATYYYGNGSNLTGISAGGSNDFSVGYAGDIFDSTTTWINGITPPIITKSNITVASYDVVIDSATSDSFGIEVGTKSADGTPWAIIETLTIPALISTHTAVSTGYTIQKGGRIKFGFTGVNTSDPSGDIGVKFNE